MTALEPGTNPGLSLARSLPETRNLTAAEPQSLYRAVQTAARSVPDRTLRPVAPSTAGPAFHPKVLLALLTYCYARQIYRSADVEVVLRRDVNFRELSPDEFPDKGMLRRFRRENRET